MPVISYFFGIYIIRMYFDDHGAPHFHAVLFVSIETGDILEGRLPTKAARLVKEWTLAHQTELMQNWWRGQALEPMQRIPGADSD